MSKMGISCLSSYQGAQIFEAIGIGAETIERWFPGTASRVGGIGLAEIARESLLRHAAGFEVRTGRRSERRGRARRRRGLRVARRRRASPLEPAHRRERCRRPCASKTPRAYDDYARAINDQGESPLHAARLLGLRRPRPSPSPSKRSSRRRKIVRRFATGAMSFGSISKEAHENLAIAMNRIGGKSNTGEGGEDEARYVAAAERRLEAERHQASRERALRRDGALPRQRRRAADQDRAGREARRRRSAPRAQGRRRDRARSPLGARRDAHLAAAAPRHLFDRGSRAAHLRPQERQPAGARQREARQRDRASAPSRPGVAKAHADAITHRRARRRDGRVAALVDPPRGHAVGARPRRDAPGARAERPARARAPPGRTGSSRRGATSPSPRCSAPRSSASRPRRSSRAAAS